MWIWHDIIADTCIRPSYLVFPYQGWTHARFDLICSFDSWFICHHISYFPIVWFKVSYSCGCGMISLQIRKYLYLWNNCAKGNLEKSILHFQNALVTWQQFFRNTLIYYLQWVQYKCASWNQKRDIINLSALSKLLRNVYTKK